MRRMTSPASLALALLSLFGSCTAAAAEPVKYWVVCWVRGVDYNADRFKQPVYISGAVPVPLASSSDFRDVATAFSRFVASTKPLPPGMTATSTCVEAQSAADAMKSIKQPGTTPAPGQGYLVDCSVGNCIMTDWNSLPASPAAVATTQAPAEKPCGAYGWKDPKKNCGNGPPATAARQPAAAPVAPARNGTTPKAAGQPARAVVAVHQAKPTNTPLPQTPYAYCWGGLAGPKQIAYFGAPFAAPTRDVPAWSAAYKKVLHEKYQFSGVMHCGTVKSLAAAQERMQKEKDQMRIHWKIVETGWKYQ